ncbi:MAG: DNA translocase FtsK 4TM domain-containing protein [Bacteroidaceae bacterium]
MPKKRQEEKPITKLTNASGIKDIAKGDTLHFFMGLLLLFLAIFMILAFISYIITGAQDQSILEAAKNNVSNVSHKDIQNQAGYLGAQIAYFLMQGCFGLAAFFIPLFLIFAAMRLMNTYRINTWRKFINYTFLMIWLSVFLSFLPDKLCGKLTFPPGGMHGIYICNAITAQIGKLGLFFVILASAIAYLIYISKRTIIIIRKFMHPKELFNKKTAKQQTPLNNVPVKSVPDPIHFEDEGSTVIDLTNIKKEPTQLEETNEDHCADIESEQRCNHTNSKKNITHSSNKTEPDFIVENNKEETKANEKTVENPYDPTLDLEFYKYPTLNLLKKYDDQNTAVDMAEQTENKNRITTILHNFGVEISSIKATVGPTITLYEITPAQGVRISKIKNLEDDIALSLSALGIRIIAPIPGKGTIGIEVPNKNPRVVSIESILNSKKFQESTFDLPIALGKTITNEVFMVDLAKMPHLLVAGATGQGKSVGLNVIITSLLYKKHPSELKFVLIDPKKVEFSIYAPLEKYFLAKIPDEDSDPIITDSSKVIRTLKSICQEMDNRYLLLKKAHCRNVKEYNKKFISRLLNPEDGHRFLPYIVVIIDEFGDLIMTSGKEVELPIARIAQLARAIGIHAVIATQRPTTNIITGTIKANFPARMAFKVMSQIDSRTILDQGGANQLIGKGDMLFLNGSTMPTRIQCAFIDTPEVEQINQFISQQQSYVSAYELPEVSMDDANGGATDIQDNEKLDPIFEEVARLIVIHQQGSTSMIQRKFSIGYNRAGRLMDQMERFGIVGPVNGAKPRDVLCADENALQDKLDLINLHS